MSSDKARITYAPDQQYRSVVMQQGRVTLEADWNEAQAIAEEALRADAQDIIGPVGTPAVGNGYKIAVPGNQNYDFSIDKGVMYVGGERVTLPDPAFYFTQPDWIDGPDPIQPTPPKQEFVYLSLREQEVSAVEDADLREVALGGPDTAQRARILQRVRRLATGGADCPAALAELEAAWKLQGRELESGTMRLRSQARLRVSLQKIAPTPDPCEPTAQDGYLGADNQLIRVQIVAYNPNTNAVTFVWGFDNASFLYRVNVINSTNLNLLSPPPDAFHNPRHGQAIEVLRAASQLSNGQFVAESAGFVSAVANYQPDGQAVTIAPPLPFPAYDPAQQHPANAPLFLRVWETMATATAGAATTLGETGLQITLTGTGFQPGDFWAFAVRPRTPQMVYPQAFLAAPQPPTGPRQWVCPLAVIAWTGPRQAVVTDCREQFETIVELSKKRASGCCTISVRPEDAPNLQAILDGLRSSEPAKRQVSVCFMPGVYALPAPLRLGPEHSNITLEACHDGVILQAKDEQNAAFFDGLLVLTHANNVTIRGMRFELPQVPFAAARKTLARVESPATTKQLNSLLPGLHVSIGVRPLHCANLEIRDCLFRFSLQVGSNDRGRNVFGVGIFAGSECWGLRVQQNRFLHDEDYLHGGESPLRLLIGYLLAPAVTRPVADKTQKPTLKATSARANTAVPYALTRSLLQDATFSDNLFQGLSIATLIYADAETITYRANTVRDCDAGFWLLSLRALTDVAFLNRTTVTKTRLNSAQEIHARILATIQQPILQIGLTLARSYPVPPEFTVRLAAAAPKSSPKTTVKADIKPAKAPPPGQAFLDKALLSLKAEARPIQEFVANSTEGGAASSVKTPQTTAVEKAPETAIVEKAPITVVEKVPITHGISRPAADAATSNSLLWQFTVLNTALPLFDRLIATEEARHGLRLVLNLTGNEIDVAGRNTTSSLALLVWDDEQDTGSTLTLGENRLRNRSSSVPTALILMTERNAITGNFFINESPSPSTAGNRLYFLLVSNSLYFLPGVGGKASAVTGNVLQGESNLGNLGRPGYPSPVDDWLFANAQL